MLILFVANRSEEKEMDLCCNQQDFGTLFPRAAIFCISRSNRFLGMCYESRMKQKRRKLYVE